MNTYNLEVPNLPFYFWNMKIHEVFFFSFHAIAGYNTLFFTNKEFHLVHISFFKVKTS